MLDYDKPAEEGPISRPDAQGNNQQVSIDNPNSTDPAAAKSTNYVKLAKRISDMQIADTILGAHLPEYDYGDDSCCGSKVTLVELAKSTNVNKALSKYASLVNAKYGTATSKLSYQVALGLQDLQKGASLETVTDNILYSVYTNWDKLFKQEVKDSVRTFVEGAYTFFRQDKSTFINIPTDRVPEYLFDLSDFRAIEYYKNMLS